MYLLTLETYLKFLSFLGGWCRRSNSLFPTLTDQCASIHAHGLCVEQMQ